MLEIRWTYVTKTRQHIKYIHIYYIYNQQTWNCPRLNHIATQFAMCTSFQYIIEVHDQTPVPVHCNTANTELTAALQHYTVSTLSTHFGNKNAFVYKEKSQQRNHYFHRWEKKYLTCSQSNKKKFKT